MKFYGAVGFSTTSEGEHGVWKEVITERKYYGDVVRVYASRSENTATTEQAVSTVGDVSIGHSISFVSDPFAMNHFSSVRYIEWMGARWSVVNIDVQPPRIIVRLGGVYNGRGPTG